MPPIAVAIAVVEHAGQFLIGQRPIGGTLAGLWEFPGGKIETGETPAAAAARECLEETGLVIDVGTEYPDVVHQYDHGRLHIHFFACRPRDPSQLPQTPFRWVPREALAKHEFPAANDALLAFLLAADA